MALLVLAACWEGDPKIEVGAPISKFYVSTTVPEFPQCDWQDRDNLSRAQRALVLPSAECSDGQCVAVGRGYYTKDGPFHIARVSDSGECVLEKVDQFEFTESFWVEIFMNRDYLRSLGLSNDEVDGLDLHNFAGTRHGELRGLQFDEINHNATITIIYDELPDEDDFVVSGQKVSFSLTPASDPLEK
ncbi:MAG: hypothetical protein ACU0GG_05645 [Paracoccaceae bacterium]